jgi:phosphatidate cytidylyltransferase
MPDDPSNDNDTSNFDDWLSEESAPPTDPAVVSPATSQDGLDATSEIEMGDIADASGSHAGDQSDVELESDESEDLLSEDIEAGVEADDLFRPHDTDIESVAQQSSHDEASEPDDLIDSGELEAITSAADDSAPSERDDVQDSPVGGLDDVLEDDAVEFSTPVVEFEDFDGAADSDDSEGDEADTGEIDIVVEVDFGSWDDPTGESVAVDTFEGAVPYDFPPETTETTFDPFEDIGEAVFIGGAEPAPSEKDDGSSFSSLWSENPSDDEPSSNVPTDEDGGDFDRTDNDIVLGATREHEGLAAAIVQAEGEDTAQVALVAEIPGLESSVVGFEDVVKAEGYIRVRARASGDLIARVVTGMILILALGASLVWRPALVVLAISVFVLGAGEFYTALVRSERKPISLFGFLGIIGASLGAFWWSAAAIPIAFILAIVMLLLFYAVVPGKTDPMGNLALTTTVMVWAGLGSFALVIARADDYQILILGIVVTVAAADIVAFFVGRAIGRTHFAPWVSPNKTVEGLVGGSIVAIGIGAGLHYFPPFELTSGLALGAAAAVLTPLGDLAMSAAKRSLGLKNMGSVLPGHGGFLDRIDGLLFAIPAAWAIFIWAGLL